MEGNIFNLEEASKKKTDEQKRIRQKEVEDMKRILKTPEGRRFVWRLWDMCGIFRNPFNPNSNQSAFNSGRMSVGHEVLIDVNDANVSAFAQMQQEHVSALKSKKEAQDA